MAQEHGPHLLMPLRLLATMPKVPRVLQLADESLLAWGARVTEALEACALIDREGRLAAMSRSCGALLGVDPLTSVGSLTTDLVTLVDFSAEGAPLVDPETQSPTRRVLLSGTPARGLVRVRHGEAIRTYDVVAVPLAGGVGALAFLTEV